MKSVNILLALSALVLLSACALPEPTTKGTMQENMRGMDNMMGMGNMDSMMGMHMVTSEYEFIREMIPHHQEAVDTAKLTLQTTKNPELKTLLNNIVVAQEKEIKMMNKWLADWYPEKTTQSNYKPMMGDLESLSGEARDKAFLKGMIMHHKMAIMMATSVLELEPRSDVKELAVAIVDSQSAEIGQMKKMLGTEASCGSNCPMKGHMMPDGTMMK